MKRLLIVYNSRSSHYKNVEEDVIEPSRHLRGWMVARFEVAQVGVDENARRLAKILQDDDLVVAAGGDGTASVAINGIMLTRAKNVCLGVMGYGNFNDVARSFGNMSFEEIVKTDATEVWPLNCAVNGKHWRYAMCYVTVGMFANACAVFDEPKTRKTLRKGGKRTLFSLFALLGWWFRQHRKVVFLPDFALGDASGDTLDKTDLSDYLAINSITVAKIMKGEKMLTKRKDFLSSMGKMNRFWKMIGFMLKSVFKKIPAETTDYDSLLFQNPSELMLQAEGEYVKFDDVTKIEICKSSRPLLAVMKEKK